MGPEGPRHSCDASCVMSPVLEWTPMLPIFVGPNTRRLEQCFSLSDLLSIYCHSVEEVDALLSVDTSLLHS